VQQADGIYGMLKFHSYLQKFISLGWICHLILPFATAVPQCEYEFSAPVIDWQEQFFILSGFAYLHQVEGQMILESPLSKSLRIFADEDYLLISIIIKQVA
jgi:hypothetical protein